MADPVFYLVHVSLEIGPDIVAVHKAIQQDGNEEEQEKQAGFAHGILEALPAAPEVSFSAFIPHCSIFRKGALFSGVKVPAAGIKCLCGVPSNSGLPPLPEWSGSFRNGARLALPTPRLRGLRILAQSGAGNCRRICSLQST